MERDLKRKLKKAAELDASTSDIDNIGTVCKREAKNYPRDSQKEAFLGCSIDKVDELNEDLSSRAFRTPAKRKK